MEISAIMNVHELAVKQNVTRNTEIQINRKLKNSKDDPTKEEAIDSRANNMQNTDEGQGIKKETLEPGHIVNFVT